MIDGPDDDGEMFERAGLPSDYFPSPFENDKAAAASNGGAVPPDLSLMAEGPQGRSGLPLCPDDRLSWRPPADFDLMAKA